MPIVEGDFRHGVLNIFTKRQVSKRLLETIHIIEVRSGVGVSLIVAPGIT